MKLLILSHLLLSDSKSVGELAKLLDMSNTYTSLLLSNLANEGFIIKERIGKKVIVRPNLESPFVRNFSRFTVMVGAYPPYSPMDFLEPESKRKIIWHLKDKSRTIDELRSVTGYSRTVIYDTLRPFLRTEMLLVSKEKRKIYSINKTSQMVKPLFQLIEYFESEMDLRPLLEKISSDNRVVALIIFGSQIFGKKDGLSDVDAFVVVNTPDDKNITQEYSHPNLQLNIYSRKGLIQLVRREPWFLKLILDGRTLKGEDFIRDLDKLPTIPEFAKIIDEIRKMLDSLDKLLDKDKVKIILYSIRTAVAMKLFVNGTLSQKRFIIELTHRYPEFDIYRKYKKNRKIKLKKIRNSKEKILEDLKHVEKAEEKER